MTLMVNFISSLRHLSNSKNSEYSNHLNTGLVWYLNGRYVFGCQMVLYSNCSEHCLTHDILVTLKKLISLITLVGSLEKNPLAVKLLDNRLYMSHGI